MRYIPLTESDSEEMLRSIGAKTIQDLFSSVPSSIRHKSAPQIPLAKTEAELRTYFQTLASKNVISGWKTYLGGGAYDHFIPTVVDAMVSRGEFSTAYTPYQPEVSQGTLQAIFEFQSMSANLFGMDVANASMYDGASSLAEAVLMASRLRPDRISIYLSKGVHPEYRQVIRSYVSDADLEIHELDVDGQGRTVLPTPFNKHIAAVIIQQPNFFGVIEDVQALTKGIKEADALTVVGTTEALAFGLISAPGNVGVDIVAGEGQSLGNPLSFGGPYVGLFATKTEHVRQMPGRLVGKTTDMEGREAYCLTLATREQHIRRERATSNICTNHSLCALRASVYMAALGKQGLREVAYRNLFLAQKLKNALSEINGIEVAYKGPSFNEFVLRLPISSGAFLEAMEREKILAGVPLSRWLEGREKDLLVTVTETKDEESIDQYVSAARKAV